MPTSYLVTGAARGLGYALVKVLAAKPETIVLALVRNKQAAEQRLAADSITNVHVLVADVTDDSALKGAAAEARSILGSQGLGLDVLIHNAAYVSEQTALTSINDYENNPKTIIEDAQRSVEVNVFGPLKVTLSFLDLVRQSRLKQVVAISSGMGDINMINEIQLANAAPYAISKGALNVLIAKLNAAYAGEGILFMSICPGRVDTLEGPMPELQEPILSRVKGIEAKFEAYIGAKVVPMRPEDAAKSVLAAVDRQSLAGGFGGSFWSHNGTKRWS
ncbi:NAD(P)-binding protein [Aspergillus japonicus CBS 114.51]|uniref:NAD(P)-binding protein n=2 Tax=Aspergillus TaxID=5052 RepID=A0A2V5HZD6_ASPV1|nr:NAD(P)-binding protein [Aspergillus japonicus CBS 114.51]PYI17217.1 NAD(P)-binding protein [Aspergillus violaceofuscus CBS 115571]RAH79935.1 NAD(P)-binding protein [Aspergillus japonicus CBS 114.51]